MNHGFRRALAVAFCFTLGTAAHADLPLTIEDLITDKGQTKLNLSIAYHNNDNAVVVNNQDILVGSLSLRYGLTGKVEIYGRGGYLYSNVRTVRTIINNNSGDDEDSDNSAADTSVKIATIKNNQFTEAWAGINYQFKEDDATPALLGFAEVAGLEKKGKTLNSFKSWRFGITSYRAIDPVVFSLSANLQLNLPRKSGNRNYRPGHSMAINPAVNFAVNDRVTLITGMQWKMQLADNSSMGYERTSTDLELGVSYGFSKENVAQIVLLSNMSGNRGVSLQFNWQHIF